MDKNLINNDNEINHIFDNIKELVINSRNKVYSTINTEMLNLYWNIGKAIMEIQQGDERASYGETVLEKLSKKLTDEFGKGFSIINLRRMRKFYCLIEKMATVSPNLSYSHYVELLPYDDLNKVRYYIKITEEQNLSIRQLRIKIKSNEYERLPEDSKNKLSDKNESTIIDYVKNPIIIKNSSNYEIISEKILQKIILEDIESFMKELGDLFCFIGSEYKIRIGNNFNYIDLLLFNIEYNCYVVVELKVTELKKEHIGQIQVYMNYIDENLRKIHQNKTIGIIICKQDNKYVIKYCSDDRIIAREYELV